MLANSLPAPTISIPALVPVKEVKASETEEEILLPLPRDVENLADDPQLHNPLQRSERMSTGWFGVSSSGAYAGSSQSLGSLDSVAAAQGGRSCNPT